MKRQGQIVAATITNFSAVEEALKNMENSAGSAEAEMETIRDSAEYAMNSLKETFTSLAQHSVSRGDLKDLINAGTTILEIVDGIVSQIGLIPTIITTIVGIISSKKLTSGGIFGKNENGKLTIFGSQVSGGFKSWLNGLSLDTPEIKAQRIELQNAKLAVEEFHNAYQNGTMTQQIYNNVLQNSNRVVRDYGNAIRMGATETDAYSAATERFSTDLNTLGKSGKVAAVGIKALNVAASMLVSLGISAALNLIIKVISDSVNSLQNHVDKLNDLLDKEKSLKSEIKELNEQLSDTKIKINELEKQDKLTILEEGELENLKETNDELERQIRLKRGELVQTSSDANKEAENTWNAITSQIGFFDVLKGNSIVNQISNLNKYKQKLEEINKLKQSDAYKNGDKTIKNQVESIQDEIDSLHDKIQRYYNEYWSKISTGLDPSYKHNEKTLNLINSLIGEWDELNKKENKNFHELYNDSKYAVVKQYLDDLAKKGELTAEKFESLTDNDVEGISAFKEELKGLENVNAEKVVEAITKAIKDAGEAGEEGADGIKSFIEQLELLQDKIDETVSKQEKLADSFKKIGLGGKLSAKEVYELVKDVPEIAKYLEKDGKEFTISQEGYQEANKALYEQIQDQVTQTLLDSKDQKDLLNEIKSLYDEQLKFTEEYGAPLLSIQEKYSELIDEYKSKYEGTTDDDLGKNIDETLKQVENTVDGYSAISQLMNDIFDEKQLIIDSLNEGFDRAKNEIEDDFNKNIETIDSAIKTLNEGELLNYDEMNALVEISPKLQDSFVQQEHGYSIVISALEDLREQSYETRNDYIDDLIAEAEAEKQAAEENKKANQEKCGYVNEYGEYVSGTLSGIENAVEKMAAQEQVDIADVQVKTLEEIIQKLKALRGDITYDEEKEEEKSLSDIMQERIDYYNTLISAIEAVKNKYTEAIDSEIDALNDSKDALKDANDERQRELDLIEARNNLENAKKHKVWVYSDANGFQQVQDEKAIKEAEEKYRNAIQDVQEAAIDKQIDELEKKKESLEKQVEDLTDLEGNIEDSKNIAQALSALGLSEEKDLLNLSDSVKQGIKEGLAEAILTKDQEDNIDNDQYVSVNLDDVLTHLGASVTADDIRSLDLITKEDFNSAINDFAQSMKEYQDKNVSNVINNSGGMTISPTFNINGVTDPNEVAKVVNTEMTNLFTKMNNSIK